jgi:hypothetical protein
MVKIVSNSHKGQIVLIITESPFAFREIFYLSIVTVHLTSTRFSFRFDANIVKCPFPHSLFFVFGF